MLPKIGAVHVHSTRASYQARILYLINSLGGGGAERSLMELLPYYDLSGIQPVVVCFRHREEGVEEKIRSGPFDLRHIADGSMVQRVHQLRRILRAEHFDLIHTTIFEADITGRLAAIGLRLPVLTSLVNTSYTEIRLSDPNVSRAGLWGARMIDGWTARRLTTHFHAITHAVKDASVRELGIDPARVTVIERGRDPSRMGSPSLDRRNRGRRAMGLDDDDEVIVSVGRQEFQKGQVYLLEAFSRIIQKRPRAKLLIVGRKGHATQALEKLHRELGLHDRARFLGYREDVPDILAISDLFVFPSLYEGQGGALVEAMALGLPIVATDIPTTREVVEEKENAVLVPVQSPEAIAKAIDGLLADPVRMKRFGRRSSEIFHTRFTLERSATRMMSMYRFIIGLNPISSPST